MPSRNGERRRGARARVDDVREVGGDARAKVSRAWPRVAKSD
ncbi:Hypothetical protein A7982_00120 [Minicystis rosea]|nr:Hypothetical protein A7982_00120 [Minicystis rosea]